MEARCKKKLMNRSTWSRQSNKVREIYDKSKGRVVTKDKTEVGVGMLTKSVLFVEQTDRGEN